MASSVAQLTFSQKLVLSSSKVKRILNKTKSISKRPPRYRSTMNAVLRYLTRNFSSFFFVLPPRIRDALHQGFMRRQRRTSCLCLQSSASRTVENKFNLLSLVALWTQCPSWSGRCVWGQKWIQSGHCSSGPHCPGSSRRNQILKDYVNWGNLTSTSDISDIATDRHLRSRFSLSPRAVLALGGFGSGQFTRIGFPPFFFLRKILPIFRYFGRRKEKDFKTKGSNK